MRGYQGGFGWGKCGTSGDRFWKPGSPAAKNANARLLSQTGGRMRRQACGGTTPEAGPSNSSLGLAVRGRRRTLPMLGHELIELFLVLGVPQALQEFLKFGLLLLKAPQRFHAVFVEGAVAARGRAKAAEAEAAALHAIAHPLHLVRPPC